LTCPCAAEAAGRLVVTALLRAPAFGADRLFLLDHTDVDALDEHFTAECRDYVLGNRGDFLEADDQHSPGIWLGIV
jgi:hypothetical protein